MSVDALREEMRGICGFGSGSGADQLQHDQFTMKWVDEEGDPCTIGSQPELDEALRLYELNKDTEITIHGQWCLMQPFITYPSTPSVLFNHRVALCNAA